MADQIVKYKYKFSEEYNPVYVNGAHGGVAPQGEIILNFYLERHSIPRQQAYFVQDGRLAGESVDDALPRDYRDGFVRYIETGVVLNLKVAKDIRDFLDSHISFLENISPEDEPRTA